MPINRPTIVTERSAKKRTFGVSLIIPSGASSQPIVAADSTIRKVNPNRSQIIPKGRIRDRLYLTTGENMAICYEPNEWLADLEVFNDNPAKSKVKDWILSPPSSKA